MEYNQIGKEIAFGGMIHRFESYYWYIKRIKPFLECLLSLLIYFFVLITSLYAGLKISFLPNL